MMHYKMRLKFTTNDIWKLCIETIVDGTISEKGMIALDAKIFLLDALYVFRDGC